MAVSTGGVKSAVGAQPRPPVCLFKTIQVTFENKSLYSFHRFITLIKYSGRETEPNHPIPELPRLGVCFLLHKTTSSTMERNSIAASRVQHHQKSVRCSFQYNPWQTITILHYGKIRLLGNVVSFLHLLFTQNIFVICELHECVQPKFK